MPTFSRLLSTILLAGIASRATAQTVGGQVVDSNGRPLARVGLRLIDSLRATVDSTVADSSGTFYLSASRPGTYIVRLDVAGLVPVASTPIRLTRDAFEQRRIALAIVPNTRIYTGDEVQRPARPYSSNRIPQYPPGLNFRDREGEVVLSFVIDSAGFPMPGTTRVVRSPDSLFTNAALRALATYRFYPAEADNHHVATLAQLPFIFRLSSERCWNGPDSLTGRKPDQLCRP